MIAVDFCCGAGGLTRGLLDSGVEVVLGIDNDEQCRLTYEHNNPASSFLRKDLRDVSFEDLRPYVKSRLAKNVLFAGCTPCQPFSQQRKAGGRSLDATLLGAFARLVGEYRPGQVLIENVPGIARVRGFSTFRRFLKMLTRLGYKYDYGVLDAKSFGVPQSRRRLVLIASLHYVVSLPTEKHGKEKVPYRTVRDAISRFPSLQAGGEDGSVPNHVAASITPINIERLKCTPKDGGDRRSWPKHLRLQCHTNGYDGHTDVYGRMKWDAPAPTLTGRCHSISNGRYGHPEQNRAISLREAAALQSFPDNYEFFGSNKHIALQIGNAVPVALAQALGRQIRYLRDRLHSPKAKT